MLIFGCSQYMDERTFPRRPPPSELLLDRKIRFEDLSACAVCERNGSEFATCKTHKMEYCDDCHLDMRKWNQKKMASHEALLSGVDLLRHDADLSSSGFSPREICVDGERFEELAPGTQLVIYDRSERIPPSDIYSRVVETVWEGKMEGYDYVGDEIWEREPHYRILYTGGGDDDDEEGGLVSCAVVHGFGFGDWEILDEPQPIDSLFVPFEDDDALFCDVSDNSSDALSVATSQVSVQSTIHCNLRFVERGVLRREFQGALKHSLHTQRYAGLPSKKGQTWLLVHNGKVFVTDVETMKVMISAWPMQEPGQPALIHDYDRKLNRQTCTLLEFSLGDGTWRVQLENGRQTSISLACLKPPKHKK